MHILYTYNWQWFCKCLFCKNKSPFYFSSTWVELYCQLGLLVIGDRENVGQNFGMIQNRKKTEVRFTSLNWVISSSLFLNPCRDKWQNPTITNSHYLLFSFFTAASLSAAPALASNWKIIAVEGVERDFWVAEDVLQRAGRNTFPPFFWERIASSRWNFPPRPWPSLNIFPPPALTFHFLMDNHHSPLSVYHVSLRNNHFLTPR